MRDTTITKDILLTRRSPAYGRVTFNHPPLNIFGPDAIPQLNEIITALETDAHVKVVVFDSAIQGSFLTHYDFLAKLEDTTGLPPGPTGLQPLPDMLVRLSRAPVASIASIRGRATGVGSELALACDMRFASREKAILSHFEVGAGVVPGGGPMARLPRHGAASRHYPRADLEVRQDGLFAAGEAHVAGQGQLASDTGGAAADRRDRHDRGPAQPYQHVVLRPQPERPRRQAGRVLGSRQEVVVSHEEPLDRAVEDDHFEVLVGFQRRDDFVELRNGFRAEDVEGRMIERDAPVRGRSSRQHDALAHVVTARRRLAI